MNKLVSKKPLILPKIKISIFLFCFFSFITNHLNSQTLNDNGATHTINFSDDVTVQEFTIPANTTYNSISFYLRGGSGGSSYAGANCASGGGDGAKVWMTSEIGTSTGKLKPGGELRVVVGKMASNQYNGGTNGRGAGGGGGTSILYRPNTSAEWILLAVAGGGGGAYQGNFFGGCVDSQKGQGGRSTTSGGDADGNKGGDGGSGGNAGEEGGGSGPGYGGRGINGSIPYGYVAGGSGFTSGGGGGGGYSGGGGGGGNDNGGGGGSYINPGYQLSQDKQSAGADEVNAHGFVEYTFGDECIATIDDIIETSGLCGDFSAMVDFQIIANTNSCTNGLIYEVTGITSVGTVNEQNTTGFFTVPAGPNFLITLYDPDNMEQLADQLWGTSPTDIYPPVAKCKDYIHTLQSDFDTFTNFSTKINNGSTDNCAIASYSSNISVLSCASIGTPITATMTVTDEAGNSSTCQSTVVVLEGKPIARCKNANYTITSGGTTTIDVASLIDDESSTPCGEDIQLTASITTFDCNNIGANTITLTATGLDGQVDECTATLNIKDGTVPVLDQNAIPVLTGDCSYQATTTLTATDACDGTILPSTDDPTSFNSPGTYTITWLFDDGNGNSITQDQTVIISDVEAPVADCNPSNEVNTDLVINTVIEVGVDPFSLSQEDINNYTSSSTDNCSIVSRTPSSSIIDCSDVGTTKVITVTLADAAGNTSTCTISYTNIVDTQAPEALCQDITLSFDDNGDANISADDIDAGSSDYCGVATMSLDETSFDCDAAGDHTVTLTVEDENNNTNTCTATVTVEDTTAPVAICDPINGNVNLIVDFPINIGASGYDQWTQAGVNYQLTNAYDNCGIVSRTVTPDFWDCSDIGTEKVFTLTVTDVAGNSSTCTVTFTDLGDFTAPDALCQDVTVQLDNEGNASITAQDIDNGSSDACGIATLKLNRTNFSCDDVGDHTVKLTVTDLQGYIDICNATVTVEDDTAPIPHCNIFNSNEVNLTSNLPMNVGETGTANWSQSDINFFTGNAQDNCGIISRTVFPLGADCSDIGAPKIFTVTFEDAAGNTSTCTIKANKIVDATAPEALCQDMTIQLDANGTASIALSDVDNGSFDHCGILSQSLSQTDFDCSHVGSNSVVMTVEDHYENTSTCTSTVIVEDNIAPVAICKDISRTLNANGIRNINSSVIDNGSSDACGIASMELSKDQFSCEDIGVNMITLTLTDINGVSSTCTSNVTITDETAPNVVCKDLVISFNGEPDILINSDDFIDFISSTDNCGTINVINPANGVTIDCEDVGNDVPFTVTVADASGNTASCTSNVTVEGLPCDWVDEGGIGCMDDLNSTLYDPNDETFTLTANNCTPAHPYVEDNIAFVFQELCGDGYIKAYVENVNGNGFAGLTLRDGSAAGAKKVALSTNRVNKLRKEVRVLDNYPAWPQELLSYDKFWIKIERIGPMVRAYASVDDQTYIPYIFQYIQMGDCLNAGMFVYGLTPGQAVTATFSQIEIGPLGGTALATLDNNFTQEETMITSADFTIFPNPATDNVNIDLSNYIGQELNLSLMSTTGQLIHQEHIEELNTSIHVLDVNRFESGVYYLGIKTKDNRITKSLIIQHP